MDSDLIKESAKKTLMNFDQSVEYLDGLIKFGIKFGLERITALCEAFGNPQNKLRVIHVAGTNGKGSTCTFIASILSEAEHRTGLYLSPYVFDIRERIQIDGRMISKDAFAEIMTEIKPVADQIGETDLGPVTEFEAKTLAAFIYFARQNVDFAVIEVGMGGRFDATNIVDPLVAVITNISLDHTERLGDTIEKIAFEKAGIIKTGAVLITAVDDQAAWQVILNRSRQEGAEVWRVIESPAKKAISHSADVHIRYTSKWDCFSVNGAEFHYNDLKPGLAGAFQHINAATAIAAIVALRKYEVRIPTRAISSGVANAYIPGRLEVLQEHPKVIIDGAHNADAALHLARAINQSMRYDQMILVIGMLNTHPTDGVLLNLAPMASKIIATQSKWSKALPAAEMAEAARRFCEDVEVIDNVPDAVRSAIELAGDDGLVLVTGSFYTIGEVG
ncbi:MAG: bifunctional folylpolyglutamate synthase/dihydrofolate synthase [Armatimonadetes bacterium]|nr:bifunctional folylpolyglutamate synthase/dihydrofolate synthase [Armatimonadota bacterium]